MGQGASTSCQSASVFLPGRGCKEARTICQSACIHKSTWQMALGEGALLGSGYLSRSSSALGLQRPAVKSAHSGGRVLDLVQHSTCQCVGTLQYMLEYWYCTVRISIGYSTVQYTQIIYCIRLSKSTPSKTIVFSSNLFNGQCYQKYKRFRYKYI